MGTILSPLNLRNPKSCNLESTLAGARIVLSLFDLKPISGSQTQSDGFQLDLFVRKVFGFLQRVTCGFPGARSIA